jgi:hypothetical protein
VAMLDVFPHLRRLMRASLAFAALSLLSACPDTAPRDNGRATSDPQTQSAPGELDKKPPEKERTFETELQTVLRAWVNRDSKTVQATCADPKQSALVRSYACYLSALNDGRAAWKRFVRSYPTDPEVLEWLAWDADEPPFSPEELAQVCGDAKDRCGPASMIDRLWELTESGDASAIAAFVDSWLTKTDGGTAQWVCSDPVPKLFKRPEPVTRALIERASSTAKGREALLVCVDFSLAGNLARKEIDAIEHLTFREPAASALKAEVVRHLRNPNPDWP